MNYCFRTNQFDGVLTYTSHIGNALSVILSKNPDLTCGVVLIFRTGSLPSFSLPRKLISPYSVLMYQGCQQHSWIPLHYSHVGHYHLTKNKYRISTLTLLSEVSFLQLLLTFFQLLRTKKTQQSSIILFSVQPKPSFEMTYRITGVMNSSSGNSKRTFLIL